MMRKSKQAKACTESLWPVKRGEGRPAQYPAELTPERQSCLVGAFRVRPLSRGRVLARVEAASKGAANQRWYRVCISKTPSVP